MQENRGCIITSIRQQSKMKKWRQIAEKDQLAELERQHLYIADTAPNPLVPVSVTSGSSETPAATTLETPTPSSPAVNSSA